MNQKASENSASQSSLLVIFLTVFIYLVGFGMIIPVIPTLTKMYGSSPLELGLVMSSYSFFQFLFAPFWGRWSDRIGRRKVLLICLFAEVFIYIGLAFSNSFVSLLVFRSLAGVFGGSISTASAYIADVTDAKNRSKGMGLIGAAFGLGFVLGPTIGGGLMGVGKSLGSQPPFGVSFPALFVAFLCLVTFVFAYFRLQEPERNKPRSSRWKLLKEVSRKPLSLVLLFGFFLSNFAMANIEPTMFLLVFDRFQWSGETASFAFAYIGIMMAFTQGFLIRKLLPKYGEPPLLLAGFVLSLLGFFLTGWGESLTSLFFAVTLIALGNGLVNPSLLGSLSATVSKDIQGEIFGVTQSFASLARILGPLAGGYLYSQQYMALPFYFAAGLAALGACFMLGLYSQLPRLARS